MSATQKLSSSLSDISRRPWSAVCNVCRDAAVFVDDGAAELLHWAGGLRLLEGCVGVYGLHSQLSPTAKDFIAAAPYCHVVIVVSDFLHGSVSQQISQLLSDLQPLECHVFCSQSEEMHAQLIPMSEGEGLDYSLGGYSHFGEFQALMRKWISREAGVRVSVQHLPLFYAEVCPGLLTTPPYSSLFPLVPASIIDIQTRLQSEGVTDTFLESLHQVEFDMLTQQYQTSLKGFASSLNGMLSEWGLAEDIFSLGSTSRFVANQLAAMPAAKVRRKTSSRQCSLVLVDRTLDLATPTLHHADSLAGKILSLLPHTPTLSDDVSVSMAPLSSTPQQSSDAGCALNGSLAQPYHPKARQLLKTLICSKQKESLMEVSRALLDCLSQEGLSVKMSGKLARPSALQLKTFIQQFRDRPQACVSQHAVLQLACAVVQAMEGDTGRHWDRLASIEKVLLLSLQDEDAPSVAAQLAQEVRAQALSSDPAPLTLVDLVGVAVAMFSLVGAETCLGSSEDEAELKEAFAVLAVKWRSCDQSFLQRLGMSQSDSHVSVVGKFESVLQRLEGLGTARDNLTQFRELYSPEAPTPLPHRPLLHQLMEATFDPGRPDLPDLCYHAPQGTVSNILKSGFSLFVSSARPRPNQHPLILLLVLGGVSCSEVRQVREVVAAAKTEAEVIVGGTRLIGSRDVTSHLLNTQS